MTEMVRTATKATGGVTPEELKLMKVHSEKWNAIAMKTGRGDRNKITEAVYGLYEAAGLKRPNVVIVPSPMNMAFVGGAAAWIWYSRGIAATTDATDVATANATYHAIVNTTTDAIVNATRAVTVNATYHAIVNTTDRATSDATTDATDRATSDATSDATRVATYAVTDLAIYAAIDRTTRVATDRATANATANATDVATRDATDRAIYAATDRATANATATATDRATDVVNQVRNTCHNLAGKGGIECAKRWWNNYQGGNMWAAYTCYLTAMRDILGLQLPEFEKYKHWEVLAQESGFRWMHEKFCIVSDLPDIIKKDEQNRPHCENGPSHKWSDGWSLYHWHGVVVPKEWIEDKSSLTAKIALSQTNIELRRAACEIIGWNKILIELDAKVIDTDPDPEIGTLLEVDLPDSGRERFIRVQCGTGRLFAIPVPLDCGDTALAANAWTYGIDPSDYNIEVRT